MKNGRPSCKFRFFLLSYKKKHKIVIITCVLMFLTTPNYVYSSPFFVFSFYFNLPLRHFLSIISHSSLKFSKGRPKITSRHVFLKRLTTFSFNLTTEPKCVPFGQSIHLSLQRSTSSPWGKWLHVYMKNTTRPFFSPIGHSCGLEFRTFLFSLVVFWHPTMRF